MNAIYDILLLRFKGFIGSVLYFDNLTIKTDRSRKTEPNQYRSKPIPSLPNRTMLGEFNDCNW